MPKWIVKIIPIIPTQPTSIGLARFAFTTAHAHAAIPPASLSSPNASSPGRATGRRSVRAARNAFASIPGHSSTYAPIRPSVAVPFSTAVSVRNFSAKNSLNAIAHITTQPGCTRVNHQARLGSRTKPAAAIKRVGLVASFTENFLPPFC